MTIKNPIQSELSDLFSEHVGGFRNEEGANYCESMDAVLPFLQKADWWCLSRSPERGASCVVTFGDDESMAPGEGEFEARHENPVIAAMLALLHWKGVEIEWK